ncbi:hypothetical protein D3C85_541750 [compost metagenome]
MQITVCATETELIKVFPKLKGTHTDPHSVSNRLQGIDINGQKFVAVNVISTISCGFSVEKSFKIILESIVDVKSYEEVLAEESVKKAEESLKAAKATLDKIKENK